MQHHSFPLQYPSQEHLTPTSRVLYYPSDTRHHTTSPVPYTAESIPTDTPNGISQCLFIGISIVLIIASTYFTLVITIELLRLPCRQQILPILALGVVASASLSLLGVFNVGWISGCRNGVCRGLMVIMGIVSLLASLGFLVVIWVTHTHHLGSCYFKTSLSPILIAIGFTQAVLSITVPLCLR